MLSIIIPTFNRSKLLKKVLNIPFLCTKKSTYMQITVTKFIFFIQK